MKKAEIADFLEWYAAELRKESDPLPESGARGTVLTVRGYEGKRLKIGVAVFHGTHEENKAAMNEIE